MHMKSRVLMRIFFPQNSACVRLQLSMAALALLLVLMPGRAAAQLDLNDLAPQAGDVQVSEDAALNALGMHLADYRVEAADAATRLMTFMQQNPDHPVTQSYRASLSYSSYFGDDTAGALADAIAEARKNLYTKPGMSTLVAGNRIFGQIGSELQKRSYTYIGVAAIGVLLTLAVVIGMIGGGMRKLSGRARPARKSRIPANTDTAPVQKKRA